MEPSPSVRYTFEDENEHDDEDDRRITTKAVAVVLLLLDFIKFNMRFRVSGMGIEAQCLQRTAPELLIVHFLFRIPA